MSTHATLTGRALDVDVLVHALDVADGGVDAGRDRVNLHRDRVQSAIQRRETLTCPVLVVPKDNKDGCSVSFLHFRNHDALSFCAVVLNVCVSYVHHVVGTFGYNVTCGGSPPI